MVFCWGGQLSFLVNRPGVGVPIENARVVMPAGSMAKHEAVWREQGEFELSSMLVRKLAPSARHTFPLGQWAPGSGACPAFLYHNHNPRVATGGADRRHSLVQTAFTVLIEHYQAGVEPLSVARRGCGGACPWPVLPLPADNLWFHAEYVGHGDCRCEHFLLEVKIVAQPAAEFHRYLTYDSKVECFGLSFEVCYFTEYKVHSGGEGRCAATGPEGQ
jgi:hypothetical protein